MATHANFSAFVKSAGVEFYPLGGDPRVLAGCKGDPNIKLSFVSILQFNCFCCDIGLVDHFLYPCLFLPHMLLAFCGSLEGGQKQH